MNSEKRLIAELPLVLGGEEVYSYLPVNYSGVTKMLFHGKTDSDSAIFPNQGEAIQAACAALIPDIGGYTDIRLVMPEEGDQITHATADDWIFEY